MTHATRFASEDKTMDKFVPSRGEILTAQMLLVAVVALAIGVAAWELPAFIILPPFFALIAAPTAGKWSKVFGSWGLATALIITLGVTVLVTSILLIGVPSAVQTAKLARDFPQLAQIYIPEFQQLMQEYKSKINDLHIFEKDINVAFNGVIDLFTKSFTEGGGVLKGLLHMALMPVTFVGKSIIVIVLTTFNLGYWHKMAKGTGNLLTLYTPRLACWLAVGVPEIQRIGRAVIGGYITIVVILLPLNILFFSIMSVRFPMNFELSLVNIMFISLFVSIGLAAISAVPGLGAKAGFVLTGVATLIIFKVGLLPLGLGIVFGFITTTIESKVLSPELIGKALGLLPPAMLTIALASVFITGVSGTIWIIFVALPVLVGVHKVILKATTPAEPPLASA